MKPLKRARMVAKTAEQLVEMLDHYRLVFPQWTEDRILATIDESAKGEFWKNDIYQVQLRRSTGIGDPSRLRGRGEFRGLPIIHLSIKRLDQQPIRDWRDLQEIKNQLVGPECEGIELFPAESRLTDTANQYHLFCIDDPTFRFGLGWNEGRFVISESGAGAVQRPL